MRISKGLTGAMMGLAVLLIPTGVYAQAYGRVNVSTLNVRKDTSTNTAIVMQLDQRQGVEILASAQGGWVQIESGDGQTGYVKGEFLDVERAVATVTVGALNMRDYPSTTDSKVLGKFGSGEEIAVHYRVGDWYNISQEGMEGFVHKDFVASEFLGLLPEKKLAAVKRIDPANPTVKTADASKKEQSVASKPASTGNKGDRLVADAKQFLGNPYVYGGNSLTNGVDCSGFVQQIMKRHDVSVSRSSRSQYSGDGYSISSDNLQKGDLLFYGYKGVVSHVAIYIGNGQVIHANDEATGIKISSAFTGAGKPFIGAKRVL
ncbi:MAG: NlpC/P60 family protein [Cellulosilyticaceae bacterium]